MADADWAKYKQIRGKPLPETIEFAGVAYTLTKVFKRDFYAATGLYQRSPRSGASASDGVSRRSRSFSSTITPNGFWFLPLRWLGRWLWRREMRLRQAVADVPGVAHVLGRLRQIGPDPRVHSRPKSA